MFIKGFGVVTVRLAAITKYPSSYGDLWSSNVVLFSFDCATSIFSCSIFPDRKGQVYSGQQDYFTLIQRSYEGQEFGVSPPSI